MLQVLWRWGRGPEVTEANREIPGKYLTGFKGCSSKKTTSQPSWDAFTPINAAQVTNRRSLEPPENYDHVDITESWWGKFHACSAATKCYRHSEGTRDERIGGGGALYTKNLLIKPSCSSPQAVILQGNFNHPDICQESSMAGVGNLEDYQNAWRINS